MSHIYMNHTRWIVYLPDHVTFKPRFAWNRTDLELGSHCISSHLPSSLSATRWSSLIKKRFSQFKITNTVTFKLLILSFKKRFTHRYPPSGHNITHVIPVHTWYTRDTLFRQKKTVVSTNPNIRPIISAFLTANNYTGTGNKAGNRKSNPCLKKHLIPY